MSASTSASMSASLMLIYNAIICRKKNHRLLISRNVAQMSPNYYFFPRLHRKIPSTVRIPEHEVAQEVVTLAHAEVVQQRLRHVAGVLEEAGQAGKHVHDLQRGEIVRLLHVLHAGGQAFLLCGHKREQFHSGVRSKGLPKKKGSDASVLRLFPNNESSR